VTRAKSRLRLAVMGVATLVLLLMAMGYLSWEPGSGAATGAKATTGPHVEGLPTLLEFGRGICPTCRQMEPIIAEIAREYKGRLNVRSVSLDEERELGAKYGINLIPTQILLDAQGREVARHVGFVAKGELVAEMKKLKLLQ
jgi:thioredoxin 1